MADHPGIAITPAATRSVAGMGVPRDPAAFLAALHDEFGVTIPVTPRWVQAGQVTLSCLAPARYLASAGPDARLPARLATRLAGLAAITDQSDMWASFALSGPLFRDLLARLVPIDLAPARFGTGEVALTRAGHLDVRLWCLGDSDCEIAVTRSHAEYLYRMLELQSRSLVRS